MSIEPKQPKPKKVRFTTYKRKVWGFWQPSRRNSFDLKALRARLDGVAPPAPLPTPEERLHQMLASEGNPAGPESDVP
jgi:hypothetical protein